MNTAIEIAEYILNKTPMSNLRLQKILYFIQGESYKRYGCPAFTDRIGAWKHGPVVPNVYNRFCAYGGSEISINKHVELNGSIQDITDTILSKYKDTYIWDLVDETHKEGTPWDKTYWNDGDKATIPESYIKDYFTERTDANEQ